MIKYGTSPLVREFLLGSDVPQLPSRLGHYTSGEALISILERRKLWASGVAFMNDSQEFQYLYRMIADMLTPSGGILDQEIQANPRLAETLRSQLIWPYENQPHLYVISLTPNDDDLSLWRAYTAPGDGYHLAFDSDRLTKVAQAQGWFLAPVRYGDSTRRLIASKLRSSFQLAASGGSHEEAVRLVYGYFRSIAPLVKHEGFSSEQEWRLIKWCLPTEEQICFRPRMSYLLPYVQFELGEPAGSPLSLIRCGPGANQDLAFCSMDLMIDAFGYNPSRGRSVVPYRPW